jgi:hypothetical protein
MLVRRMIFAVPGVDILFSPKASNDTNTWPEGASKFCPKMPRPFTAIPAVDVLGMLPYVFCETQNLPNLTREAMHM